MFLLKTDCTYSDFNTSNTKLTPISVRVDRASATEMVDSGAISGWVKSRTIQIGI